MALERTLSIIKPDAVAAGHIGPIYTRFKQSSLRIIAAKMKYLNQEEAEGFYAEHRERIFFNDLVTFMTSGPVMIQILEGKEAISHYRALMGATDPEKADAGTIRYDFARNAPSPAANAVHGSDSPHSAKREIAYFFTDDEICVRN